ncbi:MAG: c-type cytochrome [Thermodesulfobacteriota bacterium]
MSSLPRAACRWAAAALLLALLAAACAVPDGAAVYEREGCGDCHSVAGQGGRLGPDLTAVAGRLPPAAIRAYIRDPAGQNPAARMPAYPHLSEAELHALARFLER